VIVLGFTSTSGAVVAYILGLAIFLGSKLSSRNRIMAWSFAAVAALVAGIGFSVIEESLVPDTRLTKQIFLMRSEVGKVLAGENIQYYAYERTMGSGTGSALWRVQHWRDIVVAYGEGSTVEQLFGFGPGSSIKVAELLPHNEYLRMFFEEGIVGLLLFLFAWYRIIRTAPASIRYVAITIAIYSFSENNLDNFPFMALLALCLSGNVVVDQVKAVTVRPTPAVQPRPIESRELVPVCR
jgi:hypothetical protein